MPTKTPAQSAPTEPISLPVLNNASNDLPPLAPVKAGLWLSRVKNVEIQNKLNFEKTEMVNKLVWTFELIENAITRKPVIDITGVEHAPLSRLAWRDGDTKSCYSKKGVKTLTKWTGQIIQALGLDPFSAEIATADLPGRFCIVQLENYTKGDGTSAAKVSGVTAFEGDVAELEAIVLKSQQEPAPAIQDVDYDAA